MKRIYAVLITGILLFLVNKEGFSQRGIQASQVIIIEPYPLSITFYKTTHLIFPYSIKSVDRGSRDVLVQKAKGVENMLLVKAGREYFTQTNLSVITADGKLYSFLLDYTPNPSLLNLSFIKEATSDEAVSLPKSEDNEAVIQSTAERVAKEERTIHGIKDSKYKMQLRLTGLYISSDVLYYQMEIKNRSNINYDISLLRIFIRDQRRSKRTASQEIEMQPLYVHGDTSVIKGQSKNILVMALPKLTIPDQKYLSIQLMEKDGGRHLRLKVHNRTIVGAKTLVP